MLDPIMIFVFDFGVKGVALASFLAQLSMVAYFIYTLMGLHIGLSIRIALRPFSWKIYREFLSVGMAQMLMQLIIAVGIVIYNFFIVRLDVNAMAAFTLTGRIDYFIITPMLAIATALLTVVGQNWGHGNVTRTLNAYWAAVALAFSIVLVLAVMHIVLAPWMYPLFTRVVAVSDYAVLQTRIMALALPFVAISLLASEYYQAIGKPWYSVLLTLMRHVFISVPVVYLLAIVLEMRITGVYFGAMSGTFVAALLAWRLLRLSPRLLRWNQEAVRSQHLDMEVAP
ncbi:Multidrug export protein MepA [Klebsiella pneumoniae]|nr:Multidrug export protein MepA [Klebsiella pneumoniae]